MSFNQKIVSIGESFLRVPPLLLVDEIFRISFGFGGKLLKYGAKNLGNGATVEISNTHYGGISGDQLNPSCSVPYPLVPYSSNATCFASENPEIFSRTIANAVSSPAAEDGIVGGVLRTSSESLTETASYFFRQTNRADYLFHLNIGDLSSFTESITWELARTGEILGCILGICSSIYFVLYV